jgi:hypothetical protein
VAESQFGNHFYALNDNNVPMAPTQAELTPVQRYVYIMAKDHHTEDVDADPSQSMNKAHSATKGF